ncbi:MAG: GtrA family protein [Fibrobacterota bacterium]
MIIPAQFHRLLKFGITGASGIAVNQSILMILYTIGVPYRTASLCAIETAIISNFLINANWTWADRRADSLRGWMRTFLRFNLTSGATALIFNWGMLILLHEELAVPVFSANLAGIATAFSANFLISHLWVFRHGNS